MKLSGPLRKVANKLMAKFGTTAVLRTVASGVYNPETGTVSQVTTDFTIKGVFTTTNVLATENVRELQANDLIQTSERRFLFAANSISVVPTTADKLVYDGNELEIIRADRLEQDGLNIVYELILRG